MYNEISPSSTGLLAYYKFNQNIAGGTNTGATTAVESTSNANTGNLNNFALSGATSNWVESYAMVVPTSTAASSISYTGFTANWTAPAIGTVTNYVLDVSTSSTFSTFVSGYNGLSVAGTSQAVTGLTDGTTYYYRVRADKTSVTGQGGNSAVKSLSTLSYPGAALSFDGSNDYVESTSPITIGNTFTFETWVKVNSPIDWGGIMCSKTPGGYSAGHIQLVTTPTGKLRVEIYNGSGGSIYEGSTTLTGAWHHVAATYNGTDLKLYVDGNLETVTIGSNAATGSLGLNSTIVFGAHRFATGGYLNCIIDDARVWNVVRSQAQIQGSMNYEIPTSAAGLLVNYHFNQGNAASSNTGVTTLIDASGNGNNGTLINFALTGATSNWVGQGGVTLGNALTFDGSNDYVELGTGLDANFGRTSTFTTEAWIKTTSDFKNIMGTTVESGSFPGYGVEIINNVIRILFMNTNTTNGIALHGSTTVTDGVWHHIAVTYDGTSNASGFKIYVDGKLETITVDQNNLTSSTSTGGQFRLGNRIGTPSYWYNGSMDEVRIWNAVRTQTDIRDNMYNMLTGAESNLVSYYKFDATSGTTVTDVKAANNGTTFNGPTWTESYAMVVPVPTAATSMSSSRFTATWTAPTFGTVEKYYLTVDDNSNFSSPLSGYNSLDCGTNLSQLVTGLNASTTYYYKVRAYKASTGDNGGTHYLSPISAISTATPTWVSSWSTSPTSYENAIINGDYNNVGFSCDNLTVNAGKKLTISSGTLTVGGNLTLKSDASGTATILNNGTLTVAGSNNVEQYLSTARNWYVSSPLSNAGAPAGYSYFQYNEPGDNIDLSGQATDYWKNVSVASPLTVGRGYVAVLPSGPATINFTGGTLNSANKTLSLTRTSGKDKEGFNLVGNPYPSYLDITDLKLNANIESSFWIRSKTTNYVFDTYNLVSNVATTNSGLVTTSKIPPMQAFWLRVTNGNVTASVVLEDSKRSHADNAQNKFRAPSAQKLVRLQVSNGTISDEAVIYFNANAADGYDSYDSPKLSNNIAAIPEIYTIAGNEPVAINGLNEISPSKTLALGFKAGETATYSIKATQLSNFDTDTRIVLKDMLLNTEQELSQGEVYTFTSGVTNSNSRFNVIFKSAGVASGLESKSGNSIVNIYRNANNQIIIDRNDGLSQEGTIKVYNGLGQILNSVKTTGARTLLNNSYGSGVYLVTLQVADKITTRKVVLN
jgi:hypothetical protein